MDEKDLPSSGDESDVDFVPEEEDNNSDTGSEVSDDKVSEDEECSKGRKRKKKNRRSSKKTKANENEEEKEDGITQVKKDIDVDAVWADFKRDVNGLETEKTAESSNPTSEAENLINKTSKGTTKQNPTNKEPKNIFNYSTKNRFGGLSKVINQLSKKDKMSTLEKSQLDWNKFKKSEGIEEEIKTYNKGKDGYLDKQDFLQRTNLRQFEIEKDLRCARRKY